ncbi:MAG: tetratricopeptide repeat protein [Candidatus Latescibacterota bacterium]|nr:MAG: tetratricopeptide repeat protein [Candidatus Latescibacterota bacterium]
MARKPIKKKKHPPRPPTEPFEILAARGRWSRSDTRNLIVVIIAALLIRIVFYLLNKENNPLFDYPIMDGKYHHEWAKEIVAGNFWGNEVFFRAPLYPYLLAFIYKISGSSIGFAIFIQHLIGVVSASLVYLLARRLFLPAVALLAGLIAATYWPFLYFEADLLIVTLIVMLDLVALLALVLAIQRTSNRRHLLFVVAGLAIGLSATARPSVLIFLPVLPLAIILADPRRGWIRQSLLVFAAAAIVILPVLVRNYAVGRDLVPIASQGGVNFYIGNNPESDGRTAIVPGTRWDWWGGYQDAIQIAETDAGRSLKPSEVSNYYLRKGLGFVFSSPDQSIPLLGKKFLLFWAGGERSNNKYIYFFWHQTGMGGVPLPGFWLVAPLGLFGTILLWRHRRNKPEVWILYLFVLSYMAGVIAFFVNARFRLPIIPVLIIFAAYGVFYLVELWRRNRGDAWKSLGLLAVCLLAINLDFVRFQENRINEDALSHYTLGNAYLNKGDTENAIREYEEARSIHARYPKQGYLLVARNVEYNLGRLYWSDNKCEKAVARLVAVGGSDQYAVLTLEMLADCYIKLEQYENAIRAYRTILKGVPTHRKAVFGAANVYRLSGHPEGAEELLRTLISKSPGQDAEAHFELGLTLVQLGRSEEAVEDFLIAAKSPALSGRSYLRLADLYLDAGDKINALDYYKRAAEVSPDDTEIRDRIESLENEK